MGPEKESLQKALAKIQPEDMVEVICYSGYRAEELPREIILLNQSFKVDEVIEQKREIRGRRIFDVFICRVENLIVCLEKFEGGRWKIRIKNKV